MFEAEATAHLKRSGVPVTDDSPKFGAEDVQTELLAILSSDGFVDSTEVGFLSTAKCICGIKTAQRFAARLVSANRRALANRMDIVQLAVGLTTHIAVGLLLHA